MDEPPVPIAICETPEFLARAQKIWSAEEREAFIDFIARKEAVPP